MRKFVYEVRFQIQALSTFSVDLAYAAFFF